MNALRQLSRALRCAGQPTLADSVGAGASLWSSPFPWVFEVDSETWTVTHSPELGWHATDGEQVVTTSGTIVSASDPPDGHHTIRLPSTHWSALSQLGNGNASLALREAVIEYLRDAGRLL